MQGGTLDWILELNKMDADGEITNSPGSVSWGGRLAPMLISSLFLTNEECMHLRGPRRCLGTRREILPASWSVILTISLTDGTLPQELLSPSLGEPFSIIGKQGERKC